MTSGNEAKAVKDRDEGQGELDSIEFNHEATSSKRDTHPPSLDWVRTCRNSMGCKRAGYGETPLEGRGPMKYCKYDLVAASKCPILFDRYNLLENFNPYSTRGAGTCPKPPG